jgi:hypothetical protein
MKVLYRTSTKIGIFLSLFFAMATPFDEASAQSTQCAYCIPVGGHAECDFELSGDVENCAQPGGIYCTGNLDGACPLEDGETVALNISGDGFYLFPQVRDAGVPISISGDDGLQHRACDGVVVAVGFDEKQSAAVSRRTSVLII